MVSAPTAVLGATGARPAFRADGRPVTYADALTALALRGGWDAVVDEVRAAQASLTVSDEQTRARIEEQLPGQEVALRRHLGLTAADDYRAWLDRWELDVADCREHLRRRLVVGLGVAASGLVEVAVPVEGLRAHVVLEGVLDDAAARLAEDAALAPSDVEDHDAWLHAVVQGAARERLRPPDPVAIESVVTEKAVDWTVVEATVVVTSDDDVAHELLLCVREQRAPLAEVAADVGLPSEAVSTTLDVLPAWLEAPLVGAGPASVIGPLPHPDGRAVVQLLARRRPSADDEQVRRRAAAVLLERRAAVAIASHVRWGDGG